MENTLICQSCGMPMDSEELFGTEADSSKNQDYCIYCYKDGAFTWDCTMEEMIQHNVQYLGEFNKNSEKQFSPEEAVEEMRKFFPSLKRWK